MIYVQPSNLHERDWNNVSKYVNHPTTIPKNPFNSPPLPSPLPSARPIFTA